MPAIRRVSLGTRLRQAHEKSGFEALYQKRLRALKLKGHARKTIAGYATGVRRLGEHLKRCPGDVTKAEARPPCRLPAPNACLGPHED